jgi:hypothetical protein
LVRSPRKYPGIEASQLEEIVSETLWLEDHETAHWRIARMMVKMIRDVRELNNQKAHILQVALALEVVGAFLVATSVFLLLTLHP